jgi:hypothetical protein
MCLLDTSVHIGETLWQLSHYARTRERTEVRERDENQKEKRVCHKCNNKA